MMVDSCAKRSSFRFSARMARPTRRTSRHASRHGVEVLESRQLLATFTVTSLNASGPGSLRQAIIDSNNQPGPYSIDFDVAGTIKVGRTSLPVIKRTVTIDGSTAPSFAGSPVVTVDFQGTRGFLFAKGADGSTLASLAVVRAASAGVTLDASHITIQGNYIGLAADGTTVAGNRGDGVRINASSHGDLIGQSNPVSSINYYNADSVSIQPVTGWQGIRGSETSGQYLITGTSGDNGLLYEGPISGAGGSSYLVEYRGAATTSVYGPDDLGNGSIRLVGSYKLADASSQAVVVNGFVFQGTTADLPSGGSFQTVDYPAQRLTSSTARWVTSPWATPTVRKPTCLWAPAMLSFTTSQPARSCPTSFIRALCPRQRMASGITAARATRFAAAIPTPATRAGQSPTAIWSTTTRRPAYFQTGRRSTIPPAPLDRSSSPIFRASAVPRTGSTRSAPTRACSDRAMSFKPRS